jgi:hypothetical protein
MQEGCTEKMINENGNRCADPKPTVIRENGTLWLKTRDGRLHALTKEDCLWLGKSCFERLFGLGLQEVYQPPDPPSAFDV